jgi:hypothetical protein
MVVSLPGAPAAAVTLGHIEVTQLYIDGCEDIFSTCEWKLTCRMGGGPPNEVVGSEEGSVGQAVAVAKGYEVTRFPIEVACTLDEDDGILSESWLRSGEGKISLPGGGDYALELKGEQGAVRVDFVVDSFEMPDVKPVAQAAAKTTGKPAAKAAAQEPRQYLGVFSRNEKGHGVVLGLPWNAFKTRLDAYAAAGVHAVALQSWEEGGQTLWGGVFRTDEGKQEVVADLEWEPFVARWKVLADQGMRLSDFEIVRKGQKFFFTGVYHEGEGENPVWIGQTRDEFLAKYYEHTGNKMRLVDLELYRSTGSKLLYAGVFRDGSGGHGIWNGMTSDELRAKLQGASRSTIVDLVSYSDGGKRMWDAVTRGGTGELTQPLDGAAFAKEWKQRSGKDLRLTNLETIP